MGSPLPASSSQSRSGAVTRAHIEERAARAWRGDPTRAATTEAQQQGAPGRERPGKTGAAAPARYGVRAMPIRSADRLRPIVAPNGFAKA